MGIFVIHVHCTAVRVFSAVNIGLNSAPVVN